MLSDQDIQTVVEKYHQGITYGQTQGYLNFEQLVTQVLSVIIFSISKQPDVLFDVLRLGADDIQDELDRMHQAIDLIKEALPDLTRERVSIENLTDLSLSISTLQKMDAYGKIPTGQIETFTRGASSFLATLKPAISSGSSYKYPPGEAASVITNNVATLSTGWYSILKRVPLLRDSIDGYLASDASIRTARTLIQAVLQEFVRIYNRMSSAKESSRTDNGLEDFLYLLIGKNMLSEWKVPVDPRLAKISTGTLTAVGTGLPASLTASRSGPFHITAATNTFSGTIDGSALAVTLPQSTYGWIDSLFAANYTIPPATVATVAAGIAGPYTTPVRASGLLAMTFTLGSRIVTDAGAAFVGVVQRGDVLIRSATWEMYFVEEVINNTTLVLTTPSTVNVPGASYNIYRNNIIEMVLHGTHVEIPMDVGAGIVAATWAATLAGVIGAYGTVTTPGGMITIEDNETAEKSSIWLVPNSEPGNLMGLGLTDLTLGTGFNRELGVLTDLNPTIESKITLTDGIYTAAQMVTEINTQIGAGNWQADLLGTDRVRLRSVTQGQSGWIKIVTGNAVLGFHKNGFARGTYVSADAVVRYINESAPTVVKASSTGQTIVSGQNLSTAAGSDTVTDAKADFSDVLAGDCLHITTGENAGWYHISSVVGTTQLVLTAEWSTTLAIDASDISYRVMRDKITLGSMTDTPSSYVTIGAGSANPVLGFTNGQSARGLIKTFQIYQSGSPIYLDEYGLTNNDLLRTVTPNTSTKIASLTSTTITLENYLNNNISPASFDIISASALEWIDLEAALTTWWSTVMPLVFHGSADLDALVSLILRAVSSPTAVYTGDALREVLVLEDALFNAVTGLETYLKAYAPRHLPETDALLAMLNQEALSRLKILFMEGDLVSLFKGSVRTANQAHKLAQLIGYGLQIADGTDQQIDSHTMTETEQYGLD